MFKDRHARTEVQCEQCGTSFMARVERVKNGQGRFCSRKCSNLYQKENSSRLVGFENGTPYFSQTEQRWIVRWFSEDKKPHNTSYAKWWWTLNVGQVPDGHYVTHLDEDSTNIDPSNFACVPEKDVRVRNTKKHIGMKRSDESRKKMSEIRYGKPLSESHRENIGRATKRMWERGVFDNTVFVDISGDKNPSWRGGVGQEYPHEFSRSLRNFVRERDHGVCQICGVEVTKRGKTMGHIHHIDGHKDHNDLDNLILLCLNCHIKVHKSKDVSSPVILAFRSKLHWNQ